MKNLSLLMTVIMAVLMAATPLFAAETMEPGGYPEVPAQSALTADLLYGLTVYNEEGKKIGVIGSVNVNDASGIVNYVNITGTDVNGAEKSYPVPPEALKIDTDHGKATLRFAEDKLENVPTKMGMSDEEYRLRIDQHYGVAPAWQENKGGSGYMMNKEVNPNKDTNEY